MNTKTFFAAGLIAAAAQAISAVEKEAPFNLKGSKLHTPRVTLSGPYW